MCRAPTLVTRLAGHLPGGRWPPDAGRLLRLPVGHAHQHARVACRSVASGQRHRRAARARASSPSPPSTDADRGACGARRLAGRAVLRAPRRVRPTHWQRAPSPWPGWRYDRRGLVDDVHRRGHLVAARVLDVHELVHVNTRQPGRRARRPAPQPSCRDRGTPRAAGTHVSLADDAAPRAPPVSRGCARRRRAAAGSSLGRPALARTRRLGLQARPGLHHGFFYLRPRGAGRAAGARPHRRCHAREGALRISATGEAARASAARRRRGIVEADGSAASLTGLERIVGALGSEGLRPEPLGSLARSPAVRASSSGERTSITAPPISSASESVSGTPPKGVSEKRSPSSSGASTTGTSV